MGRNTPPPPDPGFNYSQLADGQEFMSDMMSGMRNSLLARGFEHHEAGAIVVALVQHNAADAWAVVGRMWGMSDPEEEA